MRLERITFEFDCEGESIVVPAILAFHVVLVVADIVTITEPSDF